MVANLKYKTNVLSMLIRVGILYKPAVESTLKVSSVVKLEFTTWAESRTVSHGATDVCSRLSMNSPRGSNLLFLENPYPNFDLIFYLNKCFLFMKRI